MLDVIILNTGAFNILDIPSSGNLSAAYFGTTCMNRYIIHQDLSAFITFDFSSYIARNSPLWYLPKDDTLPQTNHHPTLDCLYITCTIRDISLWQCLVSFCFIHKGNRGSIIHAYNFHHHIQGHLLIRSQSSRSKMAHMYSFYNNNRYLTSYTTSPTTRHFLSEVPIRESCSKPTRITQCDTCIDQHVPKHLSFIVLPRYEPVRLAIK